MRRDASPSSPASAFCRVHGLGFIGLGYGLHLLQEARIHFMRELRLSAFVHR
jgi:hypothetical protein